MNRRLARAAERAILGLLVFGFICGLGVLAALVLDVGRQELLDGLARPRRLSPPGR